MRRRIIQEYARRGSGSEFEMDWVRTEYPGASMAVTEIEVQGRLLAPTFAPESGELFGAYGAVTITNPNVGTTTVRYTTDGSEPDGSSAVSAGSVAFALPATLKAAVFMTDGLLPSPVTEGAYTSMAGSGDAGLEDIGASMAVTEISWQYIPLHIVDDREPLDTEEAGASMALTEIDWEYIPPPVPPSREEIDDADTEEAGASMALTEIEWQYIPIIEV